MVWGARAFGPGTMLLLLLGSRQRHPSSPFLLLQPVYMGVRFGVLRGPGSPPAGLGALVSARCLTGLSKYSGGVLFIPGTPGCPVQV